MLDVFQTALKRAGGYFFLSLLPCLSGASLLAAVPQDNAERERLIGAPVELVARPASISLRGPLAMQQIIVSGHYRGGVVRDLTPFAKMQLNDPSIAKLKPNGFVLPLRNGKTKLIIRAGGQTVRVPVVVTGMQQPRAISFRHDVIPSLNVGGCNAGACHGTPSGKNGFRLSLRGYDPAADYIELTHDIFGRRTNRNKPASSLMLLKALGRVEHGGGVRFSEDDVAAQMIQQWLGEGMPDDAPKLPRLTKIAITPGDRVLHAPARWQQIAVMAHFSDGAVRDVTRLTVFSSSENSIAAVDRDGLVEFARAGEIAVLCRYLDKMEAVRLIYLQPRKDLVWTDPPVNNFVDRHVFAKLKMLNIQPSALCTDEEFVRRAYLDVCAILPSPKEVRSFLSATGNNKRAELIDRLLKRQEYTDFWTMKWMDVLRNKRESLHIKGAKAYQRWMHNHIQKNTPFDQVTRELLTASGSTFQNGAANYYRVTDSPEELAETTAQLFFGVRMQCAKCHNHPFERWTQDDYYSTAAFFAQVKRKTKSGRKAKRKKPEEEIVYLAKGEVKHLRTGDVMPPRFLGGIPAAFDKQNDRRQVLAAWLTEKDNPFFARSVVNRIWYHLMGRGIVDPVDDFRDSNPPANEELLNALADDFRKHNFDVKHIIRTIMTSRTYQLSAASNEFNKDDDKYFSKAITKLLTAEQLLDAICIATDVPEDFADVPRGTRATQLPDGGRNHPFLKAFGQPARELACECERGGNPSLAQALQLLNGKTVQDKVSTNVNRIGKLLDKKWSDKKIVEELYLATLSRLPQQREIQASLGYVNAELNRRKAWEDVLWALLNTKEFMFRH